VNEDFRTVGPAEPELVAQRYARRRSGDLYSILRPEVIASTQELQRRMLRLFSGVCGFDDARLRELRLVDVGCGYGGHLLDFLRLGMMPEHLCGIELLPERAALARHRLPPALRIVHGDANAAAIEPGGQDIVFQSVVFSSLLDDGFQQSLADGMWRWLKPGGGVLWYDFVVDNPRNPDVRGVPLKRVRALFPEGRITACRVTLAPPISRRVCRLMPLAYPLFNALPFLRTHLLCWIQKT
jgi:SAM-dependent methyltransferase